MFVFVDSFFPPSSIHCTMTSFLIGKALEDQKVKDWKVCLVGRDPLVDICQAMTHKDTRLLVISHNIFSIRNTNARRTIRKGVANCPGKRVYFIDEKPQLLACQKVKEVVRRFPERSRELLTKEPLCIQFLTPDGLMNIL